MNSVRSDRRGVRVARVSVDRVFELASHLTERDREIVLSLYDHQLLTTDQLELLFFSSKRRAQDRLLFLYRHRLLDRFYPPSPFGAGKPQAHWLLSWHTGWRATASSPTSSPPRSPAPSWR